MEGIKQCPRNDDGTEEPFTKKKICREDITNEYKAIRQHFNPNDKSPNLFNKRLHLRMKSYYNLLNNTNSIH